MKWQHWNWKANFQIRGWERWEYSHGDPEPAWLGWKLECGRDGLCGQEMADAWTAEAEWEGPVYGLRRVRSTRASTQCWAHSCRPSVCVKLCVRGCWGTSLRTCHSWSIQEQDPSNWRLLVPSPILRNVGYACFLCSQRTVKDRALR